MSSGQALTDLNTYWINFNDINGTRKKKCKRSSIHKTFTNPTYINRVNCVVDTLNSVTRNNTPRFHLIGANHYRRRFVPLNGAQRAAAAEDDQEEEEEEEEEENNNASSAASTYSRSSRAANANENNSPAAPLRASAAPTAAAAASSRSSRAANTNENNANENNSSPAASSRSSRPASAASTSSRSSSAAAPIRLSRAPTAKSAADAAAALAKFKKDNPPKKINEIFNGNILKTVSDLIKEKCFSNKAEFDKVPITLDLMATDDTKKPIYTILFDGKLQYNGKRYILKQDNTTFTIKEIDAVSRVVKGEGGRRKTQKKNKHKKRTTSKRR